MRNLAENAAAAFDHLHRQTQLVDLRSKRQVVVFTMTPEPPHICVLDFAENLVEAATLRGYLDARGYRDQNDPTLPAQPTFRKELGEPVFTAIPAESSSQYIKLKTKDDLTSKHLALREIWQTRAFFREPMHEMSVYISSTRQMWPRLWKSEKQSTTGYEIMTSIRLSTERFNGYEGCIVLQNANTLPLHPHRR